MVPQIMTDVGVTPTGIEFMDRLTLDTSCNYLRQSLEQYKNAGAVLVLELEGNDEEQILNEPLALLFRI